MNLTILTATYNRAHTLERLYKSLLKQSNINFEWLIIDDGSIDETYDIISSYIKDEILHISYFKKVNEGKHSALNFGFNLSKGDWIFIVDSDDWLDFDCVENVNDIIADIQNKAHISSICMLQKNKSGLNVGSQLNTNHKNYLEMIESSVTGDKCDVFKKSFVKNFEYPVFPNERFMSELPLYIYLSKISDTHFVNFSGYNCEYNIGGLSDESIKLRYRNINSTLFVYSELYLNSSQVGTRMRAAVNWWRFFIFNSGKITNISSTWKPPIIMYPLGMLFFIFDKIRGKV